MGGGGEGVDKGRRNGAVTDDDVQGCGTYGVALWGRYLGSDGCDAEGDGGVTPYIGSSSCRDARSASQGEGIGVFIGGGGLVVVGFVASEGVHLEELVYHCGVYCESPNQ